MFISDSYIRIEFIAPAGKPPARSRLRRSNSRIDLCYVRWQIVSLLSLIYSPYSVFCICACTLTTRSSVLKNAVPPGIYRGKYAIFDLSVNVWETGENDNDNDNVLKLPQTY